MSKFTSQRRIALLTSSSLGLAAIAAAASLTVTLAPTNAFAANECTPVGLDPSANGAMADTYSCTGSKTGTGVTYTSAGDLTINVTGSLSVGAFGLNATGVSPDSLTVNVTGGNVTATSGNAIHTVAGGDATIAISSGRTVTGTAAENWLIDATTAAGRTTTITNAGTITSNAPTFSGILPFDDLAIRGSGAGGVVIGNSGLIRGRFDFSSAGSVVVNNTGTSSTSGWRTFGTSTFSAGADVLNIAAGSGVYASPGQTTFTTGPFIDNTAIFAFGGGVDTINNNGRLVIGDAGGNIVNSNATSPANLTITGLEVFNNAGPILLGGISSPAAAPQSDNSINDVLVMQGTQFNGLAGSRLFMDVRLGVPTEQTSCVVLTAADCVDISNGSTSGVTGIVLNDVTPTSAFAGYLPEGIVLVDVSGGTSAAEDFVLDPASTGYIISGPYAGLIKRGYFIYEFGFDPDAVQHKVVSVPDTELMEFTAFGQAVQGIWRTSTADLVARQADVRDGDEGAGVWLRAAGEAAERDLTQSVSNVFGSSYTFDNSYDQKTVSLTGGLDLFSGEGYNLGASVGYVKSDLRFTNSTTRGEFKGGSLGVYGSYAMGGFFVDAAVNGVLLRVEVEDSAVGLPGGLTTRPMVRALGGQVEAGWRAEVGGGLTLEPLVTASYASSRFDQIVLTQVKIDYEDQSSLRAGAGLRAAFDAGFARFSLTGRYWNEFDGENGLTVDNDAVDLSLVDDFSGQFTEVNASASFTLGAGMAAFLNAGGRFADGYQAANASVGATYRW